MSNRWEEQSKTYKKMYADRFEQVKHTIPQSLVPAGERGPWSVKKFTLKENDVSMALVRAAVRGDRGYTPPGPYTGLYHKGRGVVMSDTLDELMDHVAFVHRACGDILVCGLGLGVVTQALLKKAIASVTVLEIDPDVIALVGPHIKDPHEPSRLKIVQADARTWKPAPGVKYDYIWHDIWDTICGDNWKDMKRQHRRYARWAVSQDSWCRELTRENA